MASASPQRVVAQVYALMGRPSLQKLPVDDVNAARIAAGMEILRAIAANPQHGDFGSLATLVTVAHNSFLPAHDGEPGIPVIVPFSGGNAREGVPATPDEIDAYREDAAAIYTDTLGDGGVAHNAADLNNKPSPVACRYSIVNGRFKFTGFSAQIPLIQLTRSLADTGVPENYEPAIVKLALGRLAKDGQVYARAGQEDLLLIAGGARAVSPVPNVEVAQKEGGVI